MKKNIKKKNWKKIKKRIEKTAIKSLSIIFDIKFK
jgi:hypothetical protein